MTQVRGISGRLFSEYYIRRFEPEVEVSRFMRYVNRDSLRKPIRVFDDYTCSGLTRDDVIDSRVTALNEEVEDERQKSCLMSAELTAAQQQIASLTEQLESSRTLGRRDSLIRQLTNLCFGIWGHFFANELHCSE